MRIKLLPGMTNVMRFPVERRARPTLTLLREIAPDVREVMLIAEAFDIGMSPPGYRDHVDAETAEHILNQVDGLDAGRLETLDGLLVPVLAAAVEACHAAHDTSLELAEAQAVLQAAQAAGRAWLDPLRERKEALASRMALSVIAAHTRSEEAEGVARAVRLARSGEAWTPRDCRADMDFLLAVHLARRAG